jgi:hypothetical protein
MVLVLAIGWSAPALAGGQAQELFRDGQRAFASGQYAQALEHFRDSDALEPSSEAKFEIARSLQHLGRFDEAVATCEALLAAKLTPVMRPAVEDLLQALKQERALNAPPSTTFNDEPAAQSSPKSSKRKKIGIAVGVVCGLLVVGAGVGLAIGLTQGSSKPAAGDVDFSLPSLGQVSFAPPSTGGANGR